MKTKKNPSSFWGDTKKHDEIKNLEFGSMGFHDTKKRPTPILKLEGDFSDRDSSQRLRGQQARPSASRPYMIHDENGRIIFLEAGMREIDYRLNKAEGSPHPWRMSHCENTDCRFCHAEDCVCGRCEDAHVNGFGT